MADDYPWVEAFQEMCEKIRSTSPEKFTGILEEPGKDSIDLEMPLYEEVSWLIRVVQLHHLWIEMLVANLPPEAGRNFLDAFGGGDEPEPRRLKLLDSYPPDGLTP